MFRFKIPIRVQDPTGVISLTLFDGDANRLLRKNAQELLEIFIKVGSVLLYNLIVLLMLYLTHYSIAFVL